MHQTLFATYLKRAELVKTSHEKISLYIYGPPQCTIAAPFVLKTFTIISDVPPAPPRLYTVAFIFTICYILFKTTHKTHIHTHTHTDSNVTKVPG